MSINQKISLYTSGGTVPTIIHVKQYDHNSRKIVCSVWKDGVPLMGIDETVVEVSCTKPNGSKSVYRSDEDSELVQASGFEISFFITADMIDRQGSLLFDVAITDGDTKRLGLFQIVLKITPSTYPGGTTHSTLTAYTHEQMAAFTHAQIESGEI